MRLDLTLLLGLYELVPKFNSMLAIVGMNGVKSVPEYPLEGKAGIFQSTLTHEFWRAIWTRNPHPPRKDLKEYPPYVIPGAHFVFLLLLFIDKKNFARSHERDLSRRPFGDMSCGFELASSIRKWGIDRL